MTTACRHALIWADVCATLISAAHRLISTATVIQGQSFMSMQSTNPHVLVVDDDPAMRELIGEYLSENDLRVTAVESGAEMTRVLKEYVVDVILLDLRLGGEDGLRLARQVRETSEIPLIIVTGKKEEADRVMGLEM